MKRKIDSSVYTLNEKENGSSVERIKTMILEDERLQLRQIGQIEKHDKKMKELIRKAEIVVKKKQIEWDSEPYVDRGIVTSVSTFGNKENLLIEYINDKNFPTQVTYFNKDNLEKKIEVNKYNIIFSVDIADKNYQGGIKPGPTEIKEVIIIDELK